MSTHMYAQKEIIKSSMFVRVYNLDGKKINKGHVTFVGDTILGLKRHGNIIQINVREIGTIKTKRSAGHNLLIGTTAGAAAGAILGVVTVNATNDLFGNWFYHTESDGLVGGAMFGAVAGACNGGITAFLKHSNTYIINGDLEKWQVLKDD
ncbi:hypothetical protein [Confluentibacter flavum]|uniref:hypothetical protein n=1 Tax=Confluentibacter flavum TaxID=1909700 RepID=UPI0012FEEA56|nr:hypothetical protein [Confluentibacter flavum]